MRKGDKMTALGICRAVLTRRLAWLVIGLMGLAASPALAKGVLPKGTPYAAETTASIIGTVDMHYTDDNSTSEVCDPNASQFTSAEIKVDKTFSFDWAANYPHVTVPVADTSELGAAYKRLHVPAQPTSEGHGGLTTSSYDITGTGPATTNGDGSSTDCSHTPFGGSGRFSNFGSPDFSRLNVTDFFGDTRPVYYFTMDPIFASPATYQDSYGNTIKVSDDEDEVYNLIPLPSSVLETKPTWDSVPADFSIDELRTLIHGSTVRLHPNVYSGTLNCSEPPGPVISDVCSLNWTFRWTVTLHKKFLYVTKRAYRR